MQIVPVVIWSAYISTKIPTGWYIQKHSLKITASAFLPSRSAFLCPGLKHDPVSSSLLLSHHVAEDQEMFLLM